MIGIKAMSRALLELGLALNSISSLLNKFQMKYLEMFSNGNMHETEANA